jgi:molybdenum cofactor synthesis domain-containing protein
MLRVGILTVSDRSFRGERRDASGPALENEIRQLGWLPAWREILPDDRPALEKFLSERAESGQTDLILTTGGTGFAPRDVTPEATSAVIERPTPGLAEAIRAESIKITPHGMLSRGTSGIRARTLIVNLSGSPKAAVEQLQVIAAALPHAVQLLQDSPDSEKGH